MATEDKFFFALAIVSFVVGSVWHPAYLATGFCLGWLIGPILLDRR